MRRGWPAPAAAAAAPSPCRAAWPRTPALPLLASCSRRPAHAAAPSAADTAEKAQRPHFVASKGRPTGDRRAAGRQRRQGAHPRLRQPGCGRSRPSRYHRCSSRERVRQWEGRVCGGRLLCSRRARRTGCRPGAQGWARWAALLPSCPLLESSTHLKAALRGTQHEAYALDQGGQRAGSVGVGALLGGWAGAGRHGGVWGWVWRVGCAGANWQVNAAGREQWELRKQR